jgi:hypothetical protein
MQKGEQKSWKCRWESCSTTDTGTEFDVSFKIDQSKLEQVSVSQYETVCTNRSGKKISDFVVVYTNKPLY